MDMKTQQEFTDLGLKNCYQPDNPDRRMIGFEMQPLVEALGIEGGVCRLVIEVDVNKPVKVYFSRFLKKGQMDNVVDYFNGLRQVETVECESVAVSEDGGIVFKKKEIA